MPRNRVVVLCAALVAASCGSSSTPAAPSSNVTPADGTIRLAIGQSTQVAVGLNDPPKSSVDPGFTLAEGWEDYRFRVVRVTASEPGTALLRVVSDAATDDSPTRWKVRNTTCCSWIWQSVHQVMVTVPVPTDFEVELIIPVSGPAQTFTVSTSRVDE